jgi:L-lysine exporter family protein LysE/ArgO
MSAFLSGFFLGLSLIIAIGAQNAFILKQGLRKEHVFILCLLCAASDSIFIFFGVFGFSLVVNQLPLVEPIARYGGAIFLFYYGAKSFWISMRNNQSLIADADHKNSLTSAILSCLAFTWLNPHAYLDTVVLLGSISTRYPNNRLEFAIGASIASFIFFYTLGYGAKLLAPIFKKPIAWKVLDFLIGCVMWIITFSLLRGHILNDISQVQQPIVDIFSQLREHGNSL